VGDARKPMVATGRAYATSMATAGGGVVGP